MKTCIATLESRTPYSQSRQIDLDVFPRKEKETIAEHEERLWREKATYNADGVVCIPQMALKMAVDEAVKRLNLGIPGRGKSTYTKFFAAGQLCAEDVPIGVRKDDLECIKIWANADGVRGSGKRVIRRFPYIMSWSGVATFEILDDIITKEVFEKALKEAGSLIGIGRFRPEKGGFLGRFVVKSTRWVES